MDKLDKTTKWKIWLSIVGIVGTITITLFTFFTYSNGENEVTKEITKIISGKFLLLSLNIAFLIASLHLLLYTLLNEQKDKIDKIDQKDKIDKIDKTTQTFENNLKNVSSILQLEDVHERIFKLEEGNMKTQYLTSLKYSLEKLSKYIKEERSGELEKNIYYTKLEETAKNILKDKEKHKDSFSGKIWALTFCLNNEWDKADGYEKKWFEVLENLDKSGITTNRLWVFNKDMVNLLNGSLTDDCKELLEIKLSRYCRKDSKYPNTISYAVSESTIVNEQHMNEFGKGFFAIQLSDGSLQLIYSCAKDKVRTSLGLCGEIDYNEKRMNEIQDYWTGYFSIAGQELNQFLKDNSAPEVFEYMKSLNFNFNLDE